MIPFVIVKTKAGFAYVRPEHVVAINASDSADCMILMTDGVTIAATEPAEDVVSRLEAESEEEDHDELEPKPKRKPKIIEHQYSIAEAVEIAPGDLSGLASECRQATDAAPDSLQPTERFQVLAASADALEDVADEGPTMARLGVSA